MRGIYQNYQVNRDSSIICTQTKNVFINDITECSKKKNISLDLDLINLAIEYIVKHHNGQYRHSGEPYYTHPIRVARIVCDYFCSTEVIVSALLHDIVEDTRLDLFEIKFIFGAEIAQLVDALTKVSMDYKLSSEETFCKLSAMSEKHAILIKLADRLDNMRTIKYIKSIEKQKRIATETLQIYVPLAGIYIPAIKKELRILAMDVLSL